MQTSQKHQTASGLHMLYPQLYCSPQFQVVDKNALSNNPPEEHFFTLESSTASGSLPAYDSPSVSVSSNHSPFSPQASHSCLSDPRQSPDNVYGSPFSGSSSYTCDEAEFKNKIRELEFSLMSCDSKSVEFSGFIPGATKSWNWNELLALTPQLDLKEVLIEGARAVSEGDTATAFGCIDVLEQMVSVSGDPIQRLGAYMLEGLRARLEGSGSNIYKALKCKEPTGRELMSYMGVLYEICPYWKFAYISSNAAILEAMVDEPRIHIVDFQIAQGTQYVYLIQQLAKRPGGPPLLRLTGLDDSQSNYARGGGLSLVGEKLSRFAQSCGVPFEFQDGMMSGCEVQREHLGVKPGFAIAVNFPYVLHHMPDESVSVHNHRDRLLQLVRSLSPKLVTLIEQESNTNTSPFLSRFMETLDYYTAMFESIDAGRRREDEERIRAEQHCVARDIVNMIGCEEGERVERHELLGKWRMRMMMAGFMPCELSTSVVWEVNQLLKGFDPNYRLAGSDGALFLLWKRRAMSTCSAWTSP
ncbi:PREDICTED: scarecrow-like protein 13 [Tarenaya hassleriana]|uniref:scarecrow-like protein 13 n=1 Tax=Tarenaya hassleriana TaxID=28532 RepID=UPI00053C5A92|nr:PREDICTED: scarecrow-like protein 13 [Tarenaya hassleriana]XP_010518735.1 PREDICTED: scarecrow-like protein 13 [Tarenaya hassleriana]